MVEFLALGFVRHFLSLAKPLKGILKGAKVGEDASSDSDEEKKSKKSKRALNDDEFEEVPIDHRKSCGFLGFQTEISFPSSDETHTSRCGGLSARSCNGAVEEESRTTDRSFV